MNGRVIMMKAALGMAFALVLANCASAPKTAYKRLDGRSVFSDPALRQQGEIDLATCRAVALNAGSQVYVPPPFQSHATNVYVNTAPDPGRFPVADFSALGDVGAIMQRNREVSRRGDVELANMQACMAQRGYTLEVVPQ
jgi:hypothetical protein